MRRTVAILAFFTALHGSVPPTPVAAQTVVVDSQVVRIAFSTLMEELAPAVAAVVRNAPPKTWLFAFPDENPAAWKPVRARLIATLNAREAATADSVLDLATIGQLSVTTDSLTFQISVGSQWKCEGHWRGKGTVTTYTAHRDHNVWSTPKQSERHVFDSDPC